MKNVRWRPAVRHTSVHVLISDKPCCSLHRSLDYLDLGAIAVAGDDLHRSLIIDLFSSQALLRAPDHTGYTSLLLFVRDLHEGCFVRIERDGGLTSSSHELMG